MTDPTPPRTPRRPHRHGARHAPGRRPLTHLSDAVLVAEQLTDNADHLVGHFVDQARRAGASWTEIGRSMGVTKQAAQKRFVPRSSPDVPEPGNWSRFTDRARAAVAGARRLARTPAIEEMQPGHLLLGLLADPDGLAARALGRAGAAWTPSASRGRALPRPASRRPRRARAVLAGTPAGCSSSPSARRSGSATTTSAPSTSCWP